MFRNINCCTATYLVTSIFNNTTEYVMTFKTVPTLLNGSVIKFRLAESITTAATAGLPIVANVNVNGVVTSVPLTDCIGNVVRTGDDLRTRTVYTAVFGSDANHLQIIKADGKKCLEV